jgi:hypothetical protein
MWKDLGGFLILLTAIFILLTLAMTKEARQVKSLIEEERLACESQQ